MDLDTVEAFIFVSVSFNSCHKKDDFERHLSS